MTGRQLSNHPSPGLGSSPSYHNSWKMGKGGKARMYHPYKSKTIERISLAQVPVREITPQEQLDILDREIKTLRGWITVYLKAGQAKEAATHQATLARFEMEREQIKAHIYADPQRAKLEKRLPFFDAILANDTEGMRRLLKAVRS